MDTRPQCEAGQVVIQGSFTAMGTVFETILVGRRKGEQACRILLKLFADEIQRLESKLSYFDPDSIVTWVNRNAAKRPVRVDRELMHLIEMAIQFNELTDGAFDITMPPAMRRWRAKTPLNSLASLSSLREALHDVGSKNIVLDGPARTVQFECSGLEIDFGGMGKGYALSVLAELARDSGVDAGLISFGGSSIFAWGGAQIDRPGWRFACHNSRIDWQHPMDVELINEGFSMSANFEVLKDDSAVDHLHVFDARTTKPVEPDRSVVVLHPDPLTAEMLSTAVLIVGQTKGCVLLSQAGARGFLSSTMDGKVKIDHIGSGVSFDEG
ncbi:MAG: hypothetical protein A2289_03885 [Deltaproteobacteria bacterium RIFOXYA12_FULL_58_15]|nr:MAG: hypothetical protein A2289_03885 [Deltaproteobacteria bacterium RIFOXYA12_FULL_58_15]